MKRKGLSAKFWPIRTATGASQPIYFRFLFASGGTMLWMALKLYLVTCNLFQSGDYRSLKERLRTLDAKQVLDNQWALRSTYSAPELKEIFRQLMDDQDRIVVAEVGAEWASRRALVNMAKL
jgi:hypothetical protein